MALMDECIEKATLAAQKVDADVYFYNGLLQGGEDLICIETIHQAKARDKALLLLTTHGGDPDAAYKLARYFQEQYQFITVLISGRCKSAGTLLAIGANELAFTPYGELGPLDIQLTKVDRFDQLQSGLTIQDSLNTLEDRAVNRFLTLVRDYVQANNGLLSFASATKAAADLITQLYAPVFARIDPEEVGARARSMRIAIDYGKRLSLKSRNLKADTLRLLAETYSSHSFVIDMQEAETLFQRVRRATDVETEVVTALGRFARFQQSQAGDPTFCVLSQSPNTLAKENPDARADERGDFPANGRNSKGADGATGVTLKPRRRRVGRVPAKGTRPVTRIGRNGA